MVKDSSTTSIKKKRKSSNNESEPEADIYKKVVEYEAEEARSRCTGTDAELFFNLCKEIRESLAEIAEMQLGNVQDENKKHQLFLSICVRIAAIKKLNRTDKMVHVFGKDVLLAEKQKCDSIKLAYQNLVYEMNHLISEINKCLAFKSRDKDIDLIPFEKFLKEAPEELTTKFINLDENDAEQKHALRLARLEFELQQRKDLAALCKSLQEEKKKVGIAIVERKKKLQALLPLLNNVLEATKPLQEHLNIDMNKVKTEPKLAALLSDPLYVFYVNVISYSNVYNVDLTAKIVGSEEEALEWKDCNTFSNLDEDDDEEQENESEEIVEKKRRHRKSIQINPMEEKRKKLLEIHPLSIQVLLKHNDLALTMIFQYIPRLHIITVSSRVELPSDVTEGCACEILSGEGLLGELLPGDLGIESPNPNNAFQLRKAGLGSFHSIVKQIGHAYAWAQGICGLNFLTNLKCQENLSRSNLENVMKVLQQRIEIRLGLAKQLQVLEQNTIPNVPECIVIPNTSISALSNFTTCTFQEFCENCKSALLDEEIVTNSDMFYLATITRNNAVLKAYIVIKNSYPVQKSIFNLSLNYKTNYNFSNCDEIRDIERTLNTGLEMDSSNWVLSVQIAYLCSFLDVFLETLDTEEFPQKTNFLNSFCGRNRKRPFTFRKIGTGIFTQY